MKDNFTNNITDNSTVNFIDNSKYNFKDLLNSIDPIIYLIIFGSLLLIIILILLKIYYINGKKCNFSPNLEGKIVIITGSN